jgi:asparagine synthase (glutamine-hydrolysing)
MEFKMEHHAHRLSSVLEGAIVDALSPYRASRLALLYSAGVDSALLAKICQDVGHRPLLLSIGTAESKDRSVVERSRASLDLPVEFVTVGEKQVVDAIQPTYRLLERAGVFTDFETLNLIHLSVGVGGYIACQIANERGITCLISAHGADSLFAGFNRYKRVPGEELQATLAHDVQEAISTGLVRDRSITDAFSIDLVAPFLDPKVIELGLEIPTRLKLGPKGNKLVLREVARLRGLPGFIARRPKKSMQFSTGFWKIVKQRWSEAT